MMNSSGIKQVLTVLLVSAGLRLLLAVFIPPGYDETYYFIYGKNLAWGYFDHPPMVGLTAFLSRVLSPVHGWNIDLRLFPILLFTLTSALLYFAIRRFSSHRAALITTILFNVTPYFSFGAGAFLFPDNTLLFFWIIFLSTLIRLNESFRWSLVFLAGLSGGLVLLSKYHGVLLLPALFSLPLFSPVWRQKRYLISLPVIGLLMIITFSPNILWNARHEWISYFYQFGKGTGKNAGFSFIKLGQAIGVQAAYLSPWIFIFLIRGVYKSFFRSGTTERLLLPFILIPVLSFTLIGATRTILPHWPMPGYLGAYLLGAIGISRDSDKSAILWAKGSTLAFLLLALLLVLQSRSGLLPLKAENDPTLDGFGWSELAGKLKNDPGYLSAEHFYFTSRWFSAGELAYALTDEPDITVLNSKAPHGFAFWTDQKAFSGQTGIFISDGHKAKPLSDYKDYFDTILLSDSLDIFRNGKKVKQFKIWQCTNFNSRFPYPYGAGISSKD